MMESDLDQIATFRALLGAEWCSQISFMAGAYCSCGSFRFVRGDRKEISITNRAWANEHLIRCAYVPAITIIEMSEGW